MATVKYEHPNVSSVLIESDVTTQQVTPYTNLFCPIISEKGPDRKVEYVTSPEDFIAKFGYPNYQKYGQANYNAYNALKAGAGVYVLRCTPEYLDNTNAILNGSATYSNIIIGVGFEKTSTVDATETYNIKPTIKYNSRAYNISDIESYLTKTTVEAYTEYNFLGLYPKGRGEYYNNLGITLVPIQGRYADTYPWYIYSLTVYRNINGVVSKLESFTVSLDPDSRSVNGSSYYILDVLNKYSKYLLGSFSQTVWDSIEKDISIYPGNLNIVEATPFKVGNTYGNKVSANRLVFNANTLTINAADDTFVAVEHGFILDDSIILDTVTGTGASVVANTRYYIVNPTTDSFMLSATLGGEPIDITANGTATYNTRTLDYLTALDLPSKNLGFINGSNRIPYLRYGSNGKYTTDGLVASDALKNQLHLSKTFEDMLIKAFMGLYDSSITQTALTEIDLILDADFTLPVKQAMIDFAQQRRDCFTILDLNTNKTQVDYLDYRKNQLFSTNDNDDLETIPVDTKFVALISGDRLVYDDITKKNIAVTHTYHLSTVIPTNDKLYGIGKNYQGVLRGLITDYIENKGSSHPTEPEKEELYDNQVNYLTKTFKELYFDTQQTTLTKSSAFGEISKARAYFRIERIAKSVCNKTQWEYATEEVYKNLESSIATALESFVKDGTCEYIRPRVWADDYAKDNKLVYVYVELKFTDIIERVEITFNVAR